MAARVPPDRKLLNMLWGGITRPSYQLKKPSAARKCEVSKMVFYQLFMNHIISMKEKFPESDGRLCRYCENQLTFVPYRERTRREKKLRINYAKKVRSKVDTNLSVDRLNPLIDYTVNNIIFCCGGCNRRKNDVSPADVLNIMRVYQEVETEDPFKGTSIEGKD
jgi:5-methylcytosine-specific restriction endonuclease McrA